MEAQNNAVTIIDGALESFAGSTIVSKSNIVDVFLDVRLACSDPAVAAAVDAAIRSFETPTLVEWSHARTELVRVREVVVASPVPATL